MCWRSIVLLLVTQLVGVVWAAGPGNEGFREPDCSKTSFFAKSSHFFTGGDQSVTKCLNQDMKSTPTSTYYTWLDGGNYHGCVGLDAWSAWLQHCKSNDRDPTPQDAARFYGDTGTVLTMAWKAATCETDKRCYRDIIADKRRTKSRDDSYETSDVRHLCLGLSDFGKHIRDTRGFVPSNCLGKIADEITSKVGLSLWYTFPDSSACMRPLPGPTVSKPAPEAVDMSANVTADFVWDMGEGLAQCRHIENGPGLRELNEYNAALAVSIHDLEPDSNLATSKMTGLAVSADVLRKLKPSLETLESLLESPYPFALFHTRLTSEAVAHATRRMQRNAKWRKQASKEVLDRADDNDDAPPSERVVLTKQRDGSRGFVARHTYDTVCAQSIATFLQGVWNVGDALSGFLDVNGAAVEVTDHHPATALAKYGETFVKNIPVFGSIWEIAKGVAGTVKEGVADFSIAKRQMKAKQTLRNLKDLTGQVKLLLENLTELQVTLASFNTAEYEDGKKTPQSKIIAASAKLQCVIVQLWGLTEPLYMPAGSLEPSECTKYQADVKVVAASKILKDIIVEGFSRK